MQAVNPLAGGSPLTGIIVNVVGSILINTGSNIVKLSHTRELERTRKKAMLLISGSDETQTSQTVTSEYESFFLYDALRRLHLYCSIWYLGTTIFLVGNILNFMSFSLAAQSLLAPLGSVQFITNITFAKVVLGRKIGLYTYLGTSILISGIVLIVAFSSHEDTGRRFTISKLEDLFSGSWYIAYVITLLVICLASSCLDFIIYRMQKRRIRWAKGITYAVISATIGAQSVTFFKILSELLAALADPSVHITRLDVISSPFTYIVTIAAVCTGVFWMYRLNEALIRFDALYIIPLLQVLWMTVSTIGGGVYFQEFGSYNTKMRSLFALGMILVFIGIFILSFSSHAGFKPQKRQPGEENTLEPLIDPSSQNMQHEGNLSLSSSQLSSIEDRLHDTVRSASPTLGHRFPPFLSEAEREAILGCERNIYSIDFSFGMPMLSAIHYNELLEGLDLQRSQSA